MQRLFRATQVLLLVLGTISAVRATVAEPDPVERAVYAPARAPGGYPTTGRPFSDLARFDRRKREDRQREANALGGRAARAAIGGWALPRT